MLIQIMAPKRSLSDHKKNHNFSKMKHSVADAILESSTSSVRLTLIDPATEKKQAGCL